jgi:hypothetical protein
LPTLAAADASGPRALTWRKAEGGKPVELDSEPMADSMRGLEPDLLALLPLDGLL